MGNAVANMTTLLFPGAALPLASLNTDELYQVVSIH